MAFPRRALFEPNLESLDTALHAAGPGRAFALGYVTLVFARALPVPGPDTIGHATAKGVGTTALRRREHSGVARRLQRRLRRRLLQPAILGRLRRLDTRATFAARGRRAGCVADRRLVDSGMLGRLRRLDTRATFAAHGRRAGCVADRRLVDSAGFFRRLRRGCLCLWSVVTCKKAP